MGEGSGRESPTQQPCGAQRAGCVYARVCGRPVDLHICMQLRTRPQDIATVSLELKQICWGLWLVGLTRGSHGVIFDP